MVGHQPIYTIESMGWSSSVELKILSYIDYLYISLYMWSNSDAL